MDVAFADKTLYEETSGKIRTERQTGRSKGDYERSRIIRDQKRNRKLKATDFNVSQIPKIAPYAIGVESFLNFEDPEEALSVWCSMLTDEQRDEREFTLDEIDDPYGDRFGVSQFWENDESEK